MPISSAWYVPSSSTPPPSRPMSEPSGRFCTARSASWAQPGAAAVSVSVSPMTSAAFVTPPIVLSLPTPEYRRGSPSDETTHARGRLHEAAGQEQHDGDEERAEDQQVEVDPAQGHVLLEHDVQHGAQHR